MKKTVTLILLSVIISACTHAQSIDSSFTSNGFLPYQGPLSNSEYNGNTGNNMVIQPDGKLVVAEDFSWATPVVSRSTLLYYTYRYNPDGTPDTTFGINGVSGVYCGAKCNNRDLQLQPDGKIVMVGASEYCVDGVCGALQFVMMRLKPNGDLDSTFGHFGKLITTDVFGVTGLFALPVTLKILPDGKFIVGGAGPNGKPFVARLNSNGFPDNTFATNGVYVDTAGGFCYFKDLAISSAGDILVLLEKYNHIPGVGNDTTNISDTYVFKLTSSGNRDNTFGSSGSLIFSVGNAEKPNSIAIKPNQSMVVVGDLYASGYIALINENGTLATNIPHGYKLISIPADTTTSFKKVIALNDSRFMICGKMVRKVSGNYQEKALLVQLDLNGNYIHDFNTTGYWVFDYGITGTTGWPGRLCGFNDVDITPSGEVFATGYRNHTAARTAVCLFLLKLKDVPMSMVSGISLESDKTITSLYPNPAHTTISVMAKANSIYSIYNVQGRLVSTGRLIKGGNTIELPTSAATGIYFFTDENTGQVVKFIKN